MRRSGSGTAAASVQVSHSVLLTALLLLLLLLLAPSSSHAQQKSVRGVRKRDQAKYAGDPFRCFDGSASIPFSQVNDDYCDCADGSDEPGTAACPSSVFFCPNKGATAVTVPSSRVNDMICDCCDGSDEWGSRSASGQAFCPNTCAELGRALHQHVLDEIAATDAGLKIRQQAAQDAQKLKAEKEAKKASYEAKLATRKAALDAAKAKQAEEEAVEQAEKDRLKAIEDAAAAEKAAAEAAAAAAQQNDTQLLTLADQTEQQTAEVPPEQQQEAHPPMGNTETPAEAEPDAAPVENFPYPAEYAAPPASTPTQPPPSPAAAAELVEQEVENFPYPAQYAFHAEDGSHTHADDGSELPLEQSEEEEQLVDSGEEDEGEPHWAGVSPPRDDEDDAGDEEQQQQDAAAAPSPSPAAPAAVTSATFTLEGESTGSSSISSESAAAGSWWRQARRSVRDALSAVQPVGHEMLELYAAGWSALWDMLFPSPPTPAEAAAKAREATRLAQEKVDRTQRKVDELNKWLTADYGPDLSLASLSGQCLSFNQKQYVYEMCPYGDAHQKEGGSSTKLGSWAGLKQREDGLTALEFTNGLSCWQGPARSLTVICRCGVETVIRSVEEPSRCVYEMVLSTPLVCNAEHAKKLQAELNEQINAEEE